MAVRPVTLLFPIDVQVVLSLDLYNTTVGALVLVFLIVTVIFELVRFSIQKYSSVSADALHKILPRLSAICSTTDAPSNISVT